MHVTGCRESLRDYAKDCKASRKLAKVWPWDQTQDGGKAFHEHECCVYKNYQLQFSILDVYTLRLFLTNLLWRLANPSKHSGNKDTEAHLTPASLYLCLSVFVFSTPQDGFQDASHAATKRNAWLTLHERSICVSITSGLSRMPMV